MAAVDSTRTEPLRVLCVTSHIGSLPNVRPEAAWFIGLQREGVHMTVMTQRDSVCADAMREAGIELVHMDERRKFSPGAIRDIRKTLRKGRHQIIHLFNNKAITNGIIAALGLPVKIVTYRGQTGGVKRHDPTRYLTHLNPRIDCITCVSEAVRQDLLNNGVPARKLATIYKGHDIDWYRDIEPEDLSALGVPDDAFVIACVANNRPRKGVPVLIEAAKHLPADTKAHFLLIGIGMTGPDIREQVADSPLPDHFHLLDYTRDVLKLVAACDATVLPATRGEGLPKTIIESMGLGITPIATSTGGSPELIVDGQSGFVVPPNDPAALARAVTKVVDDPDLNRRMARAAYARLATEFTLEQSVENHRRLYESLVNASA